MFEQILTTQNSEDGQSKLPGQQIEMKRNISKQWERDLLKEKKMERNITSPYQGWLDNSDIASYVDHYTSGSSNSDVKTSQPAPVERRTRPATVERPKPWKETSKSTKWRDGIKLWKSMVCAPKISQLNGANGEATGKDDVKKGQQSGIKTIENKLNQVLKFEKSLTGNNKFSNKLAGKAKKIGNKGAKMANKMVSSATGGIHPAVHGVLSAIITPCDRTRPKCGIPTFPASNSFVARGWADFTVVTSSTSGAGFISLNPAITNNISSLCYSSASTYTGSTLGGLNLGLTGTTDVEFTNLPFASSAIGVSLQARIVGFGVEVTNMTAPLYSQGLVQTLVDPEHQNLYNYTSAQMSSRSECLTDILTPSSATDGQGRPKTYHLSVYPVQYSDGTYETSSQNPWAGGGNQVIAGMLITGASTTNPVSLLCRATIDIEYVGLTAENSCQPKSIPPPGAFEHVVQIAQKVHTHHSQNPHLKPKDLLKVAVMGYKALNTPAGKMMIKSVAGCVF